MSSGKTIDFVGESLCKYAGMKKLCPHPKKDGLPQKRIDFFLEVKEVRSVFKTDKSDIFVMPLKLDILIDNNTERGCAQTQC